MLTGELREDSLAPHAALEALRRETPPATEMLANLMDEAMESMLSRHAPARPPEKKIAAAAAAGAEAREMEDFGAVLSEAEAAALAEEVRSEPAASFLDRPEFGADVITAMPTDEELAALFADAEPAPGANMASPAGATLREQEISKAALELEQELALEIPSRPRRLRDVDEIQADTALEARGSVNLREPPVLEEEAPRVPRGRPLERAGAGEHVPWWLAPLVWLNAPLATPGAQSGAGKLAILALLNAAAVLIYVFVIRR